MLQIAAMLLKTEEEIELLNEELDSAQSSEYDKEEAQYIKYEIIVKTKGEKEAADFLEANISNPKLRRKAIQVALAHEHYSKAVSIAQEGVDLYVNALLAYVKTNVGRNHYKEACRYLRRVIKLGAREKANEVIAFFRTQYRNRTALMEELRNV